MSSDAVGKPHLDAQRHENFSSRTLLEVDKCLSVVAHELTTPITALKLQADRARRHQQKDRSKSDAILDKLLENVDASLNRVEYLVNDLLDNGRRKGTKLVLDRKRLSLSQIILDVVAEFEPVATQAGFSLVNRVTEDIKGFWDRERIIQVITNLLNNALRYGASPIEISAAQKESAVDVVVKDSGPGVPLEQHKRIFRRFARAADLQSPGLGLGLAICRQIAAAHGGSVTLDDALPGEGASFRMTIPLEIHPTVISENSDRPLA